MHKIVYLIIILTSSLNAFSQNKDTEKTQISKMDKFTSKTGSIIKYIDYSLANIKGVYSVSETKVRKIISGESVGYFFQISKEGKYDTKNASIEYYDLLEVIKAIGKLKQESVEDIIYEGNYLENKFVTDDGFQIGYYISNEKINWYIKLEKYGSGNTIFIRDPLEIETILIDAKNKVDTLKQ